MNTQAELPENLDLGAFSSYIDEVFGDLNSEPCGKTAAQYITVVPGDHIAVEVASIWHHGIFAGRKFNDDMVISKSETKRRSQ